MRYKSLSAKSLWKFSTLLFLWLIVFSPLYPDLFRTWLRDSNSSHGVLVPFIALYFIWQQRDKIEVIEINECVGGAIMLIASLFIYLVSYIGSVTFIARLMMIFSLYGLVIFCLGTNYFNAMRFSLLFLLFLVPLPESVVNEIALPLQILATTISSFLLKLFAIPVYQEGNLLYFTRAQLEVAQACSGIRSMASLVMISVIFAKLSQEILLPKLILILSAIPIALITNIVRVTATGLLANFFGEQVAQGFIHDLSGHMVFIFGLILLYAEFLILDLCFPHKIRQITNSAKS